MELSLQGQVVLVAGSSRGIGRAIAETLLQEGAGVVVTGRDPASLERCRVELEGSAPGGRLMSIAGDMSDAAVIARALEAIVARFGRIDHVIANLGSGRGTPGWDQPEEEWQRIFNHNFFGSVRLSRAVLPRLLAGGGGSILFIASIAGVEASGAPLAYSAAKAALINYSKNLARQLGPQRVRVNTIAPGNILFPGGSWDTRLKADAGKVEQMLATQVPQGRFGTPADVASLAAYLVSGRAGFATGGCHVIDGGQTQGI
jgi:3-oxoacyl-[acyl-carrier protein] reductase